MALTKAQKLQRIKELEADIERLQKERRQREKANALWTALENYAWEQLNNLTWGFFGSCLQPEVVS